MFFSKDNLFLFVNNLLLNLFIFFYVNGSCDLIVFSYNRPMQLLAYLESVEFYIKNLNEIRVIYRVDSEYKDAYVQLVEKFKNIVFIKQNDVNPKEDFKQLVSAQINNLKSEYLMFAVDDIIVTNFIDLSLCIDALNKYQAYGLYLRLGKNIEHCYTENKYSGVPELKKLDDNILTWRFSSCSGDWGYPNTVDMTIYSKEYVFKTLQQLQFCNPNTLEYQWSLIKPSIEFGLCFEHSKIINIPVNIVQDAWVNWHMHIYSAKKLLEMFINGTRINWKKYYKFENKSPHVEVTLDLIGNI